MTRVYKIEDSFAQCFEMGRKSRKWIWSAGFSNTSADSSRRPGTHNFVGTLHGGYSQVKSPLELGCQDLSHSHTLPLSIYQYFVTQYTQSTDYRGSLPLINIQIMSYKKRQTQNKNKVEKNLGEKRQHRVGWVTEHS